MSEGVVIEVEAEREWWQTALALIFWAAILGAIGFGGWKAYSGFQRQRTIRKAQMFFDVGDYKSSDYWVDRALKWDPENVRALKISARAREAEGSSTAVVVWKRITALEPTAENYVALGRAALTFHESATAQQALDRVQEQGRGSGASHELQANVAEASGDLERAELELMQALKIDPENQRCRLRLAAIRLESADPQIKDAARAAVEKFVTHPELGRVASQALLKDALARGRAITAITLARSLAAGPGSTFDNRLAYLSVLREFHHPSFSRQLLRLQDEAAGEPKRAATLISWLNANGLTLLASDWAKRLPPETRASGAVPAAIADSYAAMGDWESVKKMVYDGNWGAFEFSRLMLFARVLKMQGDESGWNEKWTSAVKAARGNPDMLAVLAANAAAWGWETEADEVLWSAANRSTNQRWALDALERRYTGNGNTRGLLRVAERRHEIDPNERATQNRLASLNLLLNIDMKDAILMAAECYQAEPKNPLYASTYAFALHLEGKTDEGMKILRSLDKTQLEHGTTAMYPALVFAAAGATDEARKLLNVAERGNLLPEESALIAKTRKNLASH